MAAKPEDAVETASDPDEDDLDDLDDVLDAFDPKPQLPAEPKPSASGPGRPPKSPPPIATADTSTKQDGGTLPQAPPPTAISTEESLEAQLQASMASLVSSLGENPEMQAQFEAMMQELIAAGNAGTDEEAKERVERATDIALPKDATAAIAADGAAPAAAGAGASKKKDDFQDTIRKTMERMQNSDTSAASASAKAGAPKSEEEMLMEMLQSLGGAEGLGGEGGEEDFNTMLLNMMTQLVNKDILYEPMKELDQKFPGWMEKNEGSVKADDLARYKEQQRLVREIVARFERTGYSDDNEADRDYIVERMQKMQEAGSPPPDLVGDMSAAQEALGELDQGCPTQ